MASALSNGSCGGAEFVGIYVFFTGAINLWEVCLVCIFSLPFVVYGTGGVITLGF